MFANKAIALLFSRYKGEKPAFWGKKIYGNSSK
jgi:hypothetical protein